MRQSFLKQHFFSCLFSLTLVACFAIYFQGLFSPPLLDDFNHLAKFNETNFNIDTLKNKLFINSIGESARPLSMLTFSINAYLFDNNFFIIKLMNLFIHLLNGFLIYQFTIALLKKLDNPTLTVRNASPWIAFFTASFWLVHPMQVSTVLYAIQRMTLLVTTFTLLGIIWYLHIRTRFEQYSLKKQAISLFILHSFGGLAVLSKENGILLYGYLLILEYCFFKIPGEISHASRWLKRLGFQLPLIAIAGYFFYRLPVYLLFYLSRDFTLPERLMAESQLLFRYLSSMIYPNLAGMGLFQDDIATSNGMDLRTFFACAFWIACTILPFIFYRKNRVLSFCILWFIISHILESTILPLELAFLHRNYLALFSISFSFSYFTIKIFSPYLKPTILKTGLGISFAILCVLTESLSYLWSNEFRLYGYFLATNPDSYRANSAFSQLLVKEEKYDEGFKIMDHMIALRPHEPGAYLEKIYTKACIEGEKIPASDWQGLMKTAPLMKEVMHYHLFMRKLISSIQIDACKGFQKDDLTSLLNYLRMIEQNKSMGGYPAPHDKTRLLLLYADIGIIAEKLENYPMILTYTKKAYLKNQLSFEPLVWLLHYQFKHYYLHDAQTVLNFIKSQFVRFSKKDHVIIPVWFTELEKKLNELKLEKRKKT